MRSIIDAELDYRNEIGDRSPRDCSLTYIKAPPVEGRTAPAVDGGDIEISSEDNFCLRSNESVKAWARPKIQEAYHGLSLGRYLRSMVTGAKSDLEQRALSEGTNSAGGFTVPTALAGEMIDKLRAQSVAIAAGARTIPMESDNLSIAKVATDPTPAFRDEAATIAESDPVFTQVQMTPRSLAMITKVSRELLDDSINIPTALPNIITQAMAKEMDRIVFQGTGSAPEPKGIINQTGIGDTALNGALTNYSKLIEARTGIETANAGPISAIVMHPRDYGTLAGLTATDNQPLIMPPALNGIRMLQTSALQIDAGSGNNESSIVVGNFNHCLIGMRHDIRIEVLRERYADTHQYGFVAVMRFDVALSHAEAFHKISGITP